MGYLIFWFCLLAAVVAAGKLAIWQINREEKAMSKRSTNPIYVLKRCSRQLKLLELKYQFAVEDGGNHCVKAERILKKATVLNERIQRALANIMVERNRDEREAHEMNDKLKEKQDGDTVDSGSNSRSS